MKLFMTKTVANICFQEKRHFFAENSEHSIEATILRFQKIEKRRPKLKYK
jgi:hypothetical protein